MSTAFSPTSYADITARINELNNAAEFIHMDIYEDEASTSFAKDSAGNEVSSKRLTSIGYTFPSTDEATGVPVAGFLTITFDNSTTIDVSDTEIPQHWYTITGVPITWN
jgi:hypothetical protein